MTEYRCPDKDCGMPEGDYHHADCALYPGKVRRP